MPIAKVFESGDSQVVHLPEEFHFASDEVEIFRRGNEVVLREKPPQEKSPQEKPDNLLPVLDILASLPEDFMEDDQDIPPPKRKGL
jgi:antitoxin VapB